MLLIKHGRFYAPKTATTEHARAVQSPSCAQMFARCRVIEWYLDQKWTPRICCAGINALQGIEKRWTMGPHINFPHITSLNCNILSYVLLFWLPPKANRTYLTSSKLSFDWWRSFETKTNSMKQRYSVPMPGPKKLGKPSYLGQTVAGKPGHVVKCTILCALVAIAPKDAMPPAGYLENHLPYYLEDHPI